MRELVKKLIPTNLFKRVEPYGHWAEAILANIVYGFPARKLKVIGVTGTNGKTTTSTLILTMMRKAGYKVGMMTTVSLDLGNGAVPNPTRLTTVTSFSLQRGLRQMVKAGAEWVVLETTSHALAQHRVAGVPYSLVAMTNITHEHLDYHGTFEHYRSSKLRMFSLANANEKGMQTGVVNADDPSANIFAGEIKNSIRYGIEAGDIRATKLRMTPTGSSMEVRSRWRSNDPRVYKLKTSLPAEFNVYNVLAAASIGEALGLTDAQISDGIASLDEVAGRMNTVDEGQDFSVIVDYAHSPDSFRKIFEEMREITKGRLIVMFGSAGRRDEAKRAIQGQIAGELCDFVIATEEDDRDADGEYILNQIAEGAEHAGKVRGKNLFLIHDRARAVQKAIDLAKTDDTVLLLGKGHETNILTNYGSRPWDEIGEARQALAKRKK